MYNLSILHLDRQKPVYFSYLALFIIDCYYRIIYNRQLEVVKIRAYTECMIDPYCKIRLMLCVKETFLFNKSEFFAFFLPLNSYLK